jgi:hypothetical protein
VPNSAAFHATFESLRALLKPYEPRLTVVMDKPRAYYLASKTSTTASGSAIWFGGVEIKKNYVSFHLIPVYANAALRESLSPSLRKRMQGKSCFNFTAIDPAHVKELAAITKKGFTGFIKQFP